MTKRIKTRNSKTNTEQFEMKSKACGTNTGYEPINKLVETDLKIKDILESEIIKMKFD